MLQHFLLLLLLLQILRLLLLKKRVFLFSAFPCSSCCLTAACAPFLLPAAPSPPQAPLAAAPLMAGFHPTSLTPFSSPLLKQCPRFSPFVFQPPSAPTFVAL